MNRGISMQFQVNEDERTDIILKVLNVWEPKTKTTGKALRNILMRVATGELEIKEKAKNGI